MPRCVPTEVLKQMKEDPDKVNWYDISAAAGELLRARTELAARPGTFTLTVNHAGSPPEEFYARRQPDGSYAVLAIPPMLLHFVRQGGPL